MIVVVHTELLKICDFSLRKLYFIRLVCADADIIFLLISACKFRFEIVFDDFEPSEIARKTDKGLNMLTKCLTAFCDCVIRELREQVDSVQRAASINKLR